MTAIRVYLSRNSGPVVEGDIDAPPRIGKALHVVLDSGRELQTSPVTAIDDLPDSGITLVKTRRSTYQLRAVHDLARQRS